ncbi:MAG: hypothetical protein ACKVVT_18490, partial [Dehalococcoidia bacterium]
MQSSHVRFSEQLLPRTAGLMVLASIAMPWVHGPNLLSGRWMSGYDLLRLTSHVPLDALSPVEAGFAVVVRFGLLAAVAVAVWHLAAINLAPSGRLARWSGAALAVYGPVIIFGAIAWEGGAPGPGALWAGMGGLAAAWPFIASRVPLFAHRG